MWAYAVTVEVCTNLRHIKEEDTAGWFHNKFYDSVCMCVCETTLNSLCMIKISAVFIINLCSENCITIFLFNSKWIFKHIKLQPNGDANHAQIYFPTRKFCNNKKNAKTWMNELNYGKLIDFLIIIASWASGAFNSLTSGNWWVRN